MKKILIINFGKSFGGVEFHIFNIIKNINKDKFKIYIITRKNSTFDKKIIDLKNIYDIDIYSLNICIRDIFRIRNIIKKNKIEVVHTHGILSSFIYSIIKAKNVRFIVTVHGYNYYDRMNRNRLVRLLFDKMEVKSLKRCDMCIAVSNDIKRYILNRHIDGHKIVVVNNGIEIKKLNDKKGKNKKIKIKSLGRLEKVKGYDVLIEAIKLLNERMGIQVECEIAGIGTERAALNELIKKFNLQKQCKLVGFVEDVNAFLQNADIYVQPSLIESFGMSILEAMNNNVVVIASKVGGIPDIVKDGYNGILFESGNISQLAEKIMWITYNKKKCDLIKKNAEFLLSKKFNIKSIVKKIELLY